jgi:hypothetical protein
LLPSRKRSKPQLDFTGPLQVLNRLPESKTHIIAKSLDPVPSDCGLSLLPTTTFKDCCQLDLICVPGGGVGVVGVMTDLETVDFVSAGLPLPVENQVILAANSRLFCVDPREGVAVIEFAKPVRTSRANPHDPRKTLCVARRARRPESPTAP